MKHHKIHFLLAALTILLLCTAIVDAQNGPSISPASESGVEPLPVMQDFELLGHLGGRHQALAVNGTFAYAGVGPELHIIDTVDPGNMNQVGSLLLDAQLSHIHLAGNYAYIGTWQKGLRIVDITAPATPVLVGSVEFPGMGSDVALSGNAAYVLVQQGVQIVDITNPAAPQLISFFPILYPHHSIAIYNNYLYANALDKLLVIDVSNPANPLLVHTLFLGVADLLVAGDYLYVNAYESLTQQAGLIIFDLNDPLYPNEVGRYLAHWNTIDQGAIRVAGNYAFLEGSWLSVLDVSNPAQPQWVDRYYFSDSHYMEVGANRLYLSNSETLNIVDIVNPFDLVPVGDYNLTPLYFASTIAVAQYAYLLPQFAVTDISDPSTPVVLGTTAPYIPDALDNDGLALQGNYLYTNADFCIVQCWSELAVIDIANPISPTLVGLSSGSEERYFQVEVSGQYAYAHGQAALAIYDISDPTTPVALGLHPHTITPSWNSYDFAVSGNYALIVWSNQDLTQGLLQIIDISDPAAPTLLASYSTAAGLTTVDVLDHYAFVADSSSNGGKLYILDIADPTAIVEVTTFRFPWYANIPGNAYQLSIVEPYLYLLSTTFTEEGTLRLLDVSDPSNPLEVGSYPIPAYAQDFQVIGNTVYVAGGNSGLYILQHNPVQVALNPGDPATLSYNDYQDLPTTFDFPTAAVTEPITITLNPTTAADINSYAFVRHTFGLSALQGDTQLPTFTFNAPVTITLHYSHDDVAVVNDEAQLTLFVWAKNGWQDATTTCDNSAPYIRDTINNILTLSICQTGRFALFGPTYQIYFPFIDRH